MLKIVFTAAKVFNVARDVDFKIKLLENNNVTLTKENFNRIIDYYSRCACFHVKFCLDTKPMPDAFITPEVNVDIRIYLLFYSKFKHLICIQAIENYLIEHNADKALLAERGHGSLNDSIRRNLIGHLADYLTSIYGLLTVTKGQVDEFCKQVIILFPSLSLKNGDDSDTVS